MIPTKRDRAWYLIELPMYWDNAKVMSTYYIKSEMYVRYDRLVSEKVINEDPLTWAEAEVFLKLLSGVQHDSE